MFELLTLRRFTKVHSGSPDEDGEGLRPIPNSKKQEYSEALRNLIRECLRPTADMRPSTGRLLRVTLRHAQEWREFSPCGFTHHILHPDDNRRVFYKENDVDEVMRDDPLQRGKQPKNAMNLGGGRSPDLSDQTGHKSTEKPKRFKSSKRSDRPRDGDMNRQRKYDLEFYLRYKEDAMKFMEDEERREAEMVRKQLAEDESDDWWEDDEDDDDEEGEEEDGENEEGKNEGGEDAGEEAKGGEDEGEEDEGGAQEDEPEEVAEREYSDLEMQDAEDGEEEVEAEEDDEEDLQSPDFHHCHMNPGVLCGSITLADYGMRGQEKVMSENAIGIREHRWRVFLTGSCLLILTFSI
jgi:hypothetical protein